MCVGTMERFSGIGDSYFKNMGTARFAPRDELDIVEEATVHDSANEYHLGGPSPSIPFCPIIECVGLLRASWMNLKVVLVDDSRITMAEGICRNTYPQDCIDENSVGTDDVGVVILESLVYFKVNPTHRISLCRWPLRECHTRRG